MGKQYDNTNRGVLFVNERKEEDRDPSLTGNLHVGDVDHWFDGWTNEARTQIDLQCRKKGTQGDNRGKGVMKKQTDEQREGHSENYPTYRGWLETAGGQKFWVSAWRREPSGKVTKPFLSVKIEPKEDRNSEGSHERPQNQSARTQTQPATNTPDDDFPL